VVISTANSLVPAGALLQLSAGDEPGPSQVYSAGKLPPSTLALLLRVKPDVALESALGVTLTLLDAALLPTLLPAVTLQL